MIKNLLFIFIIIFPFIGYGQIGWECKNIINTTGKAQPQYVTAGDVNGDGFNEIIVGATNGLVWFKNKDGLGNFNKSVALDKNCSVSEIFLSDMDGDGFTDIVYFKDTSDGNSLVWIKNIDGLGTFSAPITLAANLFSVTEVQVVDMDGDGDLDVVYSSGDSAVVLLKNSGTGTFTSQIIGVSANAFFVIDVNGDQLVDLIYKSGYILKYYQQNPDGTFIFKENMDNFIVNNDGVGFITGGDIDGDDDTDIAVFHENGNDQIIKWYKNTNNVFGPFLTLTILPSSNGASNADSRSVILKDFDNDGLIDAVMRTSFLNRISWFKNLGAGTFSPENIISNAVVNNRSIAIADFNGDGKQDVATVGFTNHDIIWFSNVGETGTVFVPNVLTEYIENPIKVAIGDLDQDGIKDVLVTSTNDNKLSWYRNTNGLGDFSEFQKVITSSLDSPRNGLIADINNDGKNDVLAYSISFEDMAARKIVQYMNQGNGIFGSEQLIFSSTTEDFTKMETIDIDNDGDLDILVSAYSGILRLFKNNGNGTYASPISFADSAGFFAPTDVDNDGDVDLVVAASPTAFFWLENTNGFGNFSAKHPITTNLGVPERFVIGDINNDGLREIIYTNSNLGKMTLNANATFGPQTSISYLGNSNVLDMADLDNDGDLDIVCNTVPSNQNNPADAARFRWYENLGNGAFGPATQIYFEDINENPNENNFRSVVLDDLNGDGKTDIILSIAYDSKVMWFKNNGSFKNKIKGTVRLDAASNGCVSSSIVAQQILVSTFDNNVSLSTFTETNGGYYFKIGEGNYTIEVSSPMPNFPSNPASYSNNFVGIDNSITADFCLQPIQFFDNIEVSFYPTTTARPGFMATYVLVVKNKGTNVISSSVGVTFNNNKLQFVSSEAPILSQSPNVLNFALTDLQPFAQFATELKFQVYPIPTVSLGEIINFSVTNDLATDATPTNNSVSFNQPIVGAYDPNDITVLEGFEVAIADSDKYLHYIIRFQNTGNYYAERVVIKTMIDDKLDWETMELESYSHSQRTEITDGSLITFTFDAIFLPGQVQDEEGSNGFIAFKIKPKNTISLGDIVQETASIYFDYNPAIVTNEVSTEYVDILDISTFDKEKIIGYPNPVANVLHLLGSETNYDAQIYNVLGQMVLQIKNANSIDFSGMPIGFYLVKISTQTKKTQVVRVLKK